jgi:hypothetical protein
MALIENGSKVASVVGVAVPQGSMANWAKGSFSCAGRVSPTNGASSPPKEFAMEYPVKNNIPYEEIENGALILLLLRESKTWEELCARYASADPTQLQTDTNTFTLLRKLFEMRDLKLISFEDKETGDGKKPVGVIKETGLWSTIRDAFGGMNLDEAAMISRHSKGMAVAPVFGRPQPLPADQQIDVFVLMPFKAKLEKIYSNHIKKMAEDLGLRILRADEIFSPRPFMEKVWDGICAAQLILADCTEKNPNVFYEIGMAHTVGKKVVLITRSDKDIPADIKHFDYIPYIYDPEGVETLIEKLRTFLNAQFNSAARNETYDKVTGSFNEPQANETVGRTIRCSGVVTGLQPGLNLWLAVEVGGLIWPKENKVLPDEANKWDVPIFEDGVTEQFSVSLFVADTSADRRIKEWLEAGRRTGKYSELRGIPGARRLARVDGLRLKTS